MLPWLPYSPDLNPIENLWYLLKERLMRDYLYLALLKKNEDSLEELIKSAKEVWDSLEQLLINDLIDSMPRRVVAVIEAKGWYTKY